MDSSAEIVATPLMILAKIVQLKVENVKIAVSRVIFDGL